MKIALFLVVFCLLSNVEAKISCFVDDPPTKTKHDCEYCGYNKAGTHIYRFCLDLPFFSYRRGTFEELNVCTISTINGLKDDLYICNEDNCNNECHITRHYHNGASALISSGFILILSLVAWIF